MLDASECGRDEKDGSQKGDNALEDRSKAARSNIQY